jgi:hypothetical protein
MTTKEAVLKDDKKLRALKVLVDLTFQLLHNTDEGIENDFRIIESARKLTKKWFPENEKTFFLLYFPRFRRVLVEKYGLSAEYYQHSLNTKFEEYFGGTDNEKSN